LPPATPAPEFTLAMRFVPTGAWITSWAEKIFTADELETLFRPDRRVRMTHGWFR
jgi:sporulation-control protein spo0M